MKSIELSQFSEFLPLEELSKMLVISQVILIHNKQILIQELRAVPEEKNFKKLLVIPMIFQDHI